MFLFKNTFRVRVNTNFCACYMLHEMGRIQARGPSPGLPASWTWFVNPHLHEMRKSGKVKISPRSRALLAGLNPRVIKFWHIHFILTDVGCTRSGRILNGVATSPDPADPVDIWSVGSIHYSDGASVAMSWTEEMDAHAYDPSNLANPTATQDQDTCEDLMWSKTETVVLHNCVGRLVSLNMAVLEHKALTFRYTDTWNHPPDYQPLF